MNLPLVVCSALLTDKGFKFVGMRHDECHYWMVHSGLEQKAEDYHLQMGFMTSDAQFLTRKQAYKQALATGQIEPNDEETLISEDIWPPKNGLFD